jgi:hypothetical protein
VVFWHKRPFEQFLRAALRDRPELLSGLSFGELKRNVSDDLVDRLEEREDFCRDLTIRLMVEIAAMELFPDLDRSDDPPSRTATAKAAVAEMGRWTQRYEGALAEHEEVERANRARREREVVVRKFAGDLNDLYERFLRMHKSDAPQARGLEFQRFLSDLFDLFDMEPKLAYSLEHEQLDGSLTFDTDDYVVEARWTKDPTARDQLDILTEKVRRKGKNALGLFVSVNGFTIDALETYRERTSFVTMDGTDLIAILNAFVRLDDLLRAKKRHANETGDCHFPAQRLIGS